MAGPANNTPVTIAGALVIVGIVIAALGGITHGSIFGGIIAAADAIPACFGMWKGIQQESQAPLAMAVSAVLISLAVGAVLIVLRLVHWVT